MKPSPSTPARVAPDLNMPDPRRFKLSGVKETPLLLTPGVALDTILVEVVAVTVAAPVWVREVIVAPPAVFDALKVAAPAPTGVG